MPEVPKPAIALPTINIFEDVATPHIREPSSKMPKKARKVHYGYSDDVDRVRRYHDRMSANLGYKVDVQTPCQWEKGGTDTYLAS